MPIPPLSQLLTPLTQAAAEAQIVAFLQNPGDGLPPLPATSWASTSLGTYFLKSESLMISDLSQAQVVTTMGGYFQLAADPSLQYKSGPYAGTSPWVDLLAQQFFNESRLPAMATVGVATLSAAPGVGPRTINPSQLLFTDGNGQYFQNVTGGTIPQGSTLALSWQAQTPGAAGNLQTSQPVTLVTALPGVTVSLGVGVSPTTWITVSGTNLESDQSLIARCLNKWTSLGTGSPQGAWINWAFAASPEVRYATTVATGLGSVQLVVWGDQTDVSPTGLAAIAAYVTAREPNCIILAPGSPANAAKKTLLMEAVIYGPASAATAGLAAAEKALRQLVQTTPIGGYQIAPGTPDLLGIANSELAATIMNSSSAITKTTIAVNNGSGYTQGADFLMPPATGVPVVAQVPGGSNPLNLSWISV